MKYKRVRIISTSTYRNWYDIDFMALHSEKNNKKKIHKYINSFKKKRMIITWFKTFETLKYSECFAISSPDALFMSVSE